MQKKDDIKQPQWDSKVMQNDYKQILKQPARDAKKSFWNGRIRKSFSGQGPVFS